MCLCVQGYTLEIFAEVHVWIFRLKNGYKRNIWKIKSPEDKQGSRKYFFGTDKL